MTTVDLTEELKEFRNRVLERMQKVDEYINKVDLEFMQLAFLASKESNNEEPLKEDEEKFQENPDVINSQMLDLLFKEENIGYEAEEDDEDSEPE